MFATFTEFAREALSELALSPLKRAGTRLRIQPAGPSSSTDRGSRMVMLTAMTRNANRRKLKRSTPRRPVQVQVALLTASYQLVWRPATLLDYSDFGLGVETEFRISVGATVLIRGPVPDSDNGDTFVATSEVRWRRTLPDGKYRAGLQLDSGMREALVEKDLLSNACG
jgi:PilZ domain